MKSPLKVVIVGGGTAGWMAAAALAGMLKRELRDIQLVESDEIATVGVGEATLPHMRDFNNAVGIIEADMMRRTNATFKLGIEFLDWGYKGSSYHHPFGSHGRPMAGVSFHDQWLRARQNGHEWDLEDFCYAIVAARANRFDFPAADTTAINASYDYAYQFDAGLYARYLRTFCEARGVVRTEGRVVDVSQDGESGDIASITLASGEVVEGDLFIDCSGFRALLIGDRLKSKWEDWGQWLPCDRALAVPCELGGGFTPFTRSTAREAGWQWRIPLQHRTGNGYVFSSAFIEADQAADVLLANLDGKALAEPKLLRFQSGRRLDSWNRNCVAIGLASGFLEPLESTSIYLIQVAITNLVRLFPDAEIDPALRDEYNRLMDIEYSRVRDFLILHYHLNSRDDSELWRHCREMDVPDSLAQRMEMFRHRGYIEKYKDGLFAPPSWVAVFFGQGLMPAYYNAMAGNLPLDRLVEELRSMRSQIAERVAMMPSHAQAIEDYCPSGQAPVMADSAA